MDKNEYSMKLEEMKLLSEERNYQAAAMIADDINWSRVRNINTLCMVGRIYEHLNRTDDARELYLMAYNRAPSSKNALYRLTRISIRTGNTQEAEMYFRNFSQNAPRDRARYVLAYQISCMKDEPLEMRIAILEDLKKREFTEEWTYELAYLYYQAGQAENCVETCDELALWFGDGEYVKKALELKRCFRPLSSSQEAKYKRLLESENLRASNSAMEAESARIQHEEAGNDPDALEAAALAEVQAALAEAVSEVEAEKKAKSGKSGQAAADPFAFSNPLSNDSENGGIPDSMITPVQRMGAVRRSNPVREPSHEELSIVSFSADRLHAELNDAYGVIERANDQDTVETALRSIRKMTVDLPFLQEAGSRAAAAFRNDAMSDAVDDNLLKNFRELKEEEIGSFQDTVPEKVSDIGNPKIEDVLTEWEKTKKAAEEAIQSARKERLAMARGAALKEAGAMIERLEEIMPIVQADVVPEASHAWDAMEKKEEEMPISRDSGLGRRQSQAAREKKAAILTETEQSVADAAGHVPVPADVTGKEPVPADVTGKEPVPADVTGKEAATADVTGKEAATADVTGKEAATADDAGENGTEEHAGAKQMAGAGMAASALAGAAAAPDRNSEDAITKKPDFLKPEEEKELEEILAKAQLEEAPGEASAGARAQENEPAAERMAAEQPAAEQKTGKQPAAEQKSAEEGSAEPEKESGPHTKAAARKGSPVSEAAGTEENLILFSREQKDLFAYFMCVDGMELMLRRAVTGVIRENGGSDTSEKGNLIVEGSRGSGKTVLATSLIKVLQEQNKKKKARIGKISAASLNNRNFAELIPKLNGGFLIVEKAGELTAKTAQSMAAVMKQRTGGLLVLLEDTPEGIEKACSLDPAFTAMFTQRVTIPAFGINELVEFGKFYAREMECTLDEMAVLAMYNRINNIRTVEHPTYLTEVKEIVDQAIISAEKGSGKKGFGKMFAKRYNEEDYLILHEEDFHV